MALLDRIHTPSDLRAFSAAELRLLADEVRAYMIQSCARTGGHIGAGLGVVELTIALHRAFDAPRDQIVWDVGHQGYPHKLLTGRRSDFHTLRQEGGISGFLKRTESEYDAFGAGHAATSISAALGMATARDLAGEESKVVAVVGDGALTSGLAYEGLNNAGASDRDIIVVLNDNEMSIAPNVGAMSRYLGSVQRNPLYNRVRAAIGHVVDDLPGPLSAVGGFVRRWEESMKSLLTPGVLFEELGFRYFGPVDGHDLDALLAVFTAVRELDTPRLVHVVTQKGKGFPAGEHNEKWHALPPGHDPATGRVTRQSTANPAYTKVFGQALADVGAERSDLVAITAAMPTGTGTERFAQQHPDRFFDVGIAEGHAVTFAAGLATRGIRPVVAIYSTFLQRAYDMVIHDVAIQHLPVIFCMDRAGLVGEDGPTHMGLYDVAYMLAVPGMTVTAPKDGTEMLALLRTALAHQDGPFAMRYPRDAVPDQPPAIAAVEPVPYGTWEVLREGQGGTAILATGTTVLPACDAAAQLAADGINVTVVNCRFLKPYDAVTLAAILARHRRVLTVEDATVVNGFGAFMAATIARMSGDVRVTVHGVPDVFIEQAPRRRQMALVGIDADGIAKRVRALLDSEALAG